MIEFEKPKFYGIGVIDKSEEKNILGWVLFGLNGYEFEGDLGLFSDDERKQIADKLDELNGELYERA